MFVRKLNIARIKCPSSLRTLVTLPIMQNAACLDGLVVNDRGKCVLFFVLLLPRCRRDPDLYHVIKNTANQNAGKPLCIRR